MTLELAWRRFGPLVDSSVSFINILDAAVPIVTVPLAVTVPALSAKNHPPPVQSPLAAPAHILPYEYMD